MLKIFITLLYKQTLINMNCMTLKKEVIWHMKQVIFDLLNSILHSFDENSLGGGESLKMLYELTFFCMHANDMVCERFWSLCAQPDRDNATILLSYAMETFPLSFVLTLTFFSLVARTNAHMCKQALEYLARMDQFCEYFDALDMDEYVNNGESVRLIRNRRVFGLWTFYVTLKCFNAFNAFNFSLKAFNAF